MPRHGETDPALFAKHDRAVDLQRRRSRHILIGVDVEHVGVLRRDVEPARIGVDQPGGVNPLHETRQRRRIILPPPLIVHDPRHDRGEGAQLADHFGQLLLLLSQRL
eukprot:TRINITY_DN102795_c0_g1_i1.p2 TRINITY_DN102795_c0_g1~~TRINITY_DN102795_c0_g1_i1.p2  ORF type:complete len:107 (+),score=5.76 TRINITY_DN102795_c0_g1_i1:2-322(+)